MAPYELMKLRLANGTHQALCYFGYLLGHRFVQEATADPDVQALLVGYLGEAVPTLLPIARVGVRGPRPVRSSGSTCTRWS